MQGMSVVVVNKSRFKTTSYAITYIYGASNMKTPRLINSKKSTRTVLQASLLILTGTLATGSAFAQKAPNTSFQNAKPSTEQSVKLSPAVLNEIRLRIAPKLSSAQVEILLSNLASMNYTQVAALTSGSASQLERLIPGVSGTASSVGQSPLSSARQASTSGNNATQKGVQQQKDMRGGFGGGTKGHLSSCGDVCGAGAGDKGSGESQVPKEKKDIDTNMTVVLALPKRAQAKGKFGAQMALPPQEARSGHKIRPQCQIVRVALVPVLYLRKNGAPSSEC